MSREAWRVLPVREGPFGDRHDPAGAVPVGGGGAVGEEGAGPAVPAAAVPVHADARGAHDGGPHRAAALLLLPQGRGDVRRGPAVPAGPRRARVAGAGAGGHHRRRLLPGGAVVQPVRLHARGRLGDGQARHAPGARGHGQRARGRRQHPAAAAAGADDVAGAADRVPPPGRARRGRSRVRGAVPGRRRVAGDGRFARQVEPGAVQLRGGARRGYREVARGARRLRADPEAGHRQGDLPGTALAGGATEGVLRVCQRREDGQLDRRRVRVPEERSIRRSSSGGAVAGRRQGVRAQGRHVVETCMALELVLNKN